MKNINIKFALLLSNYFTFPSVFINYLLNKFKYFVRLNVISLRINYQYKYNIYLLLFIFICVISSIIMRSTLINEELLNNIYDNNLLFITFRLLLFLTILYSIKLIFDIISRCIQAYKIIPEFISLYKSNTLNIKSIITLYYIQNTLFILLSGWILYIIIIKLNLFIDNIPIFILTLGIISSIIFIYYYPIKHFNINNNINNYPLWVYLLLLMFAIFYMFVLPLVVINIINSDKFIELKNEFTNKCLHQVEPNYMDSNNQSDYSVSGNNDSNRVIVKNNFVTNVDNSNNRIVSSLNENDSTEISSNFINNIKNTNNVIEVIKTEDGRSITINHNYQIDNVRLNRESLSSSASPTALLGSNEPDTSNISLSREQVQSTSNLSNQNNNTVSLISTQRNFTSLISINLNINNLFKTSPSFPLNDQNIFKISTIKYEELLLSSYKLRNFIIDNNILFYNQDILKQLTNIINDLKIFLNIQLKFTELINNNSDYITQILNENKHLNRKNGFLESNLNSNIKFNNKLFDILNYNEIISLPGPNKLLEFYILNDINYLNYKNKNKISINIIDNIILFRSNFIDNHQYLYKCPELKFSYKYEKSAYLFTGFNYKFNNLMNNLDYYNNNNINFKDINKIKKIRIINYYSYLFNKYNK